ncbi:MAG: DNA repair protein RecN [Thermoanaerobaculia bacterium]
MLRDLSIRNFAIVENLTVAFGAGFTVITGETGAGKSILVDALTLLSGGRASAEMLRHDSEKMSVAARFDDADEVRAILEQAGVSADGDLLVRREMGSDGRGRVFVNDEPATARTVSRIGEALFAIHGQGGERRLLDPDTALDLLDESTGITALAGTVRALASGLNAVETRLRELESSRRERDRLLDRHQYEIREIDSARIEGADEAALSSERNRLLHADRIRQLGESAVSELSEDEGAAADRLGAAYRALSDLARIDSGFSDAEKECADLKVRVADLAAMARDAAVSIESDPERLAELEDRLAKLSRLKQKYGASVAEILDYRDRAQAEVETLSNLDDSLDRLGKERERARGEYFAAALDLSARRIEVSRQISALVRRELSELAMEKAKFRIEVRPQADQVAARGLDRAEILFTANPGEPERPLSKVASGGELSRVQLAIESARLRPGKSGRRTLIFDEVDAGIGGRVAEVVGRKLKALAAKDQVLCVTHVPQIAALADRHLRAVKAVARGRTRASVEELAGEDRNEEIARMLAGETVTSTARDHARELLKSGAPAAGDR